MNILISLAIMGGFGVLLFKLIRYAQAKSKKQLADTAALARKHGWSFDGSRLTGTTSGVRWQLVADQENTSSESSSSTTWSTNDIRYHHLVGFIRTRKGFDTLESMWARALSGVFTIVLSRTGLEGPQHSELAKTGARLKSQRVEINNNFVVFVRPGSGLDHLLTPALENALQVWFDAGLHEAVRDSLSIDIGQRNLRVYCRWILPAEHLERFVALGITTAAAIKGQELPASP